MNETIPQLATLKITCNGATGTGVLYFPSPEADVVYVFTAKHCLAGKNFDEAYETTDIRLSALFNPTERTYHEYQLTAADFVNTSNDTQDLALLILPKQRILDLIGTEHTCLVANTGAELSDYTLRGFADFNDQRTDRPFPLTYVEDQKEEPHLFLLRSDQQLDTFRQSALDNLEGLSGCGAWVSAKGNTYLTGIVHRYDEDNIFTATKVLAYNFLIPRDRHPAITAVKPELNDVVLNTFERMTERRDEVNNRTRETVGEIHIPRNEKALLKLLDDSGIAVIYGKPGVGKSALAKALVAHLKADKQASVLTFAPEDLYAATFREALVHAGYTATLEQLLSSPLSGGRLVIWIESFEKVLESGQQDAFKDLLGLLKKHPGLRVIVTVRDYLLQKFKINFNFELPQGDIFCGLEVFSDEELAAIKEQEPQVAKLFENSRIEQFLRTPYYLDKALRILPHLLKEDQLDEAGFKRIMWEQIVEAGDAERGQVFYELALSRAQRLALYMPSTAPLPKLQGLIADHILQVEPGELANRYSPAHDILEDWALIRYIKLKRQAASSPGTFLSDLERSPAIRRAFRLWLEEYARQEPGNYASFIHQVLHDPEIGQSWKDEVMVASLRSPNADALFDAIGNRLLEDKGALLRRVIHLLQTSCKSVDPQQRDLDAFIPAGSGWDGLISFIRRHHAQILALETFEFAYLGVIEDWARQLPLYGAENLPAAAADAAWLLEDFLYRHQDQVCNYRRGRQDTSSLKQYAKILFKLTGAAQELVGAMIKAAAKPFEEHPRWKNEDVLECIRDYATSGITADQFCKYFPELVIQIATEDWPVKPKTYGPNSLIARIIPQPDASDFGLEERLKDELDFPSGYQSFVYWIMRYHPGKALDFLLPFINKAIERNQQMLRKLEKDELMDLKVTFADGSVKNYYGTYDYWVMFRGTNTRNRLLSSMLMGLEKGLMEMAESGPDNKKEVKSLLDRLVLETNNVTVIAVVASVLQAFPELLDETNVRLITEPYFLAWDQSRYATDYMPADLYHTDPLDKEERSSSHQLPHRRKHGQGLIGFVAHYMFYYGELNETLFAIIDALWAASDPRDLSWRKFLFDMDARKYRFEPIDLPGYENYRQLVPGYEPEIEEMRRFRPEDAPPPNALWPNHLFDGKEDAEKTVTMWRSVRAGYQNTARSNLFMTSPGTLATVGLQYFAEDLNAEETAWCQQVLIGYAEKQLQKRDMFDFMSSAYDQNAPMMGMSFLFKTNMTPEMGTLAKTLLFRLLTARFEERPTNHLQAGVAYHLYGLNPDLAIHCWYGILHHLERKRVADEEDRQRREEAEFGIMEPEAVDVEDVDWRAEILEKVVNGSIQPPEKIDPTLTHGTRHLLDDALKTIPPDTDLPAQHDLIADLLNQHLAFLRKPSFKRKDDFYGNRAFLRNVYAQYLLMQSPERASLLFAELLDQTDLEANRLEQDSVNSYIIDILKQMIRALDSSTVKQFWVLWGQLLAWTLKTKSMLFFDLFLLDLDWTESSEDWWVLEGKKSFYNEFIPKYGFNRITVTVKFLSGIGFRKFMPDSVKWIAQMLQSGNAHQLELKVAEKFIQKAFFNYGQAIKSNQETLVCFIFILEKLIERGSAKAYMLREELIYYK